MIYILIYNVIYEKKIWAYIIDMSDKIKSSIQKFNFMENEAYIDALYSKNYYTRYEYEKMKIKAKYEKDNFLNNYKEMLLKVYKKTRFNLSYIMDKRLNIYYKINYFSGLQKTIRFIKKKDKMIIKTVNVYDCTLSTGTLKVNYDQYKNKEIIKVFERNNSVKYNFEIISEMNILPSLITYTSHTLYSIVCPLPLTMIYDNKYLYEILINNLIGIVNSIDSTCSILFIGVYTSILFYDIVNMLSKYFENTTYFSPKYFTGQILYVIFSKKKENISEKKIKKIKNILIKEKRLYSIYNNYNYINKYKKFLNKMVHEYSTKMYIYMDMNTLKCNDDIRYDAIIKNINYHKKTVYDKFMKNIKD